MMKRLVFIAAMLLVFLMPGYTAELDVGAEIVFGPGAIKSVVGIDINKIYTGIVIETPGRGVFANINLGGAIKLTTRDLGSILLFRASVGVGYRFNRHRISIIFDHVSNANLVSHNPALNVFGIRYGYEF